MIVGNGLLSSAFNKYDYSDTNVVIFASGVSNSKENEDSAFAREAHLLEKYLSENSKKLLIYFSSCALVSPENSSLPYYKHKQNMEKLVKGHKNYLIVRLPQIIGKSENRNTILNFFIDKITKNEKLILNANASRYFIEITDIVSFVNLLISNNIKNTTINFANPYRYNVSDIVDIVSQSLNKNYTNYEMVSGGNEYIINFDNMNNILKKLNVEFAFSYDYLENNIQKIYGIN